MLRMPAPVFWKMLPDKHNATLTPGRMVQVCGFIRSPQFNNLRGEIVSHTDNGRWVVKLQNGHTIALKRINFQTLSPPPADHEAPTPILPPVLAADVTQWGQQLLDICQQFGTPNTETELLAQLLLKALNTNQQSNPHIKHFEQLLYKSLRSALDNLHPQPKTTYWNRNPLRWLESAADLASEPPNTTQEVIDGPKQSFEDLRLAEELRMAISLSLMANDNDKPTLAQPINIPSQSSRDDWTPIHVATVAPPRPDNPPSQPQPPARESNVPPPAPTANNQYRLRTQPPRTMTTIGQT